MRPETRVFPIPTLVLTTLLVALGATPASGVDGVIEINQTKALAGGVTASDTPGFPVTIDVAGTYRLTSPLWIPDAETHGIVIADGAPYVTIDLNGFVLAGPTRCTGSAAGGGLECNPTGAGRGVTTVAPLAYLAVTIRNGTVRGTGSDGIYFGGVANARIEDVQVLDSAGSCVSTYSTSMVLRNHVRGCGGVGISVGQNSLVQGNAVQSANKDGIRFGSTGESYGSAIGNTIRSTGADAIIGGPALLVRDNRVYTPSGDGIETGINGVVIGNVVVGGALQLGFGTGYANNVISNTPAIVGGVPMGGNVCNGAPCP